MPVLTSAARLANESPLRSLYCLRNCLAIRDPWFAYVGGYLELAQHSVYKHVQVKFAHSVEDRLSRLIVDAHYEGRVFFRQCLEGHSHFILVRGRFWLDSQGNDRLWELYRLQNYRGLALTERFTR